MSKKRTEKPRSGISYPSTSKTLATDEGPTEQSHGSNLPPETGETNVGKSQGQTVLVGQAEETNTAGPITVVQASAQAVEALSIASSTATATGHEDLAAASDLAMVSFQQVINHYGGNLVIQQTIDMDITIETEKQIHQYTEKLKANDIPFYDCDEKHGKCMSNATDAGAKFKCRALYAACLGYRVSEALK
jgi:hypothetical protein